MSIATKEHPFYLKMGKISESAVADLYDFFNHLPDNNYQDGAYRLRRYSAFTSHNGKIEKLPARLFSQSSDINTFQGDIARQYEDIEPACYQSAGFAEMMENYIEAAELPDGVDIEIHQLRIQAKPNETVAVAPEGVHQDGFNRLGMFMMNYQRLSGGELKVHLDKDSPAMTEYLPKAGEYLVINDAKFWHDANDIICTSNSENGYYDLFVLTAIKP